VSLTFRFDTGVHFWLPHIRMLFGRGWEGLLNSFLANFGARYIHSVPYPISILLLGASVLALSRLPPSTSGLSYVGFDNLHWKGLEEFGTTIQSQSVMARRAVIFARPLSTRICSLTALHLRVAHGFRLHGCGLCVSQRGLLQNGLRFTME